MKKLHHAPLFLPLLILLICLGFTAFGIYYVHLRIRSEDRARFEIATQKTKDSISEQVEIYISLLRGGVGLFASQREVTFQEFKTFVDLLGLSTNYPGIQGYGYAHRVIPQTKAAVVKAMRETVTNTFEITPPGERLEYFPIIYLEPPDRRNLKAIGFDMYSDPIRRAAMNQARDFGKPAATGRVTLVQEVDPKNQQAGFLIYVPVYYRGNIPSTLVGKRQACIGFVYTPFRADDLFEGIFLREPNPHVTFAVYDGNVPDPTYQLYNLHPARKRKPMLSSKQILDIAGRHWSVVCNTTPQFESQSNRKWLPWISLAGIVVSFSLSGIALVLARANQASQQRAIEASEQKERLRLSTENLTSTLESISDAFVSFNRDWEFTYVNHAAATLIERTPEEVLGKNVWSAFPHMVGTPVEEGFRHALSQQTKTEIDYLSPRTNRWYTFHAYPSRDGLSIYFADITHHKEAEFRKELHNQQASLRGDVAMAFSRPDTSIQAVLQQCTDAIMRHMSAAFVRIWLLNDQTQILELLASSGLYTHLNGPHSRIPVGHLKVGFIAQERKPYLTQNVQSDPNIDQPQWAKDKGMISFAGYPLMVGDRVAGVLDLFAKQKLPDETLETLSTMADIIAQGIERKRIQEALSQSEEQFRLIVESATDYAIFTMNLEGCITTWNSGAERLLGYNDQEIVGQNDRILFTPEDRAARKPEWELEITLAEGRTADERWQVRKDGTRFFAVGIVVPLRGENNQFRGFLKIMRDSTKQKQFQDEIQELNRDLEVKVKERTAKLQETISELEAFSYSLSHDMRAPLRAIQGMAQAVQEDYGDKIDEEGKLYLNRMMSSAERLDNLITDVLSYSRIVRSEIKPHPIDLEKLVHDVIASYPALQPPRAEIKIESPLLKVMGQEASLTQCLTNLLGNAVKFVAPGVDPQVKVRTEAIYSNVRIWFEDNGIGIPEKDLQRIFRMFERINPPTAYEGTGIGLAIVRKAVERMGGHVGVESEVGKGSRFWIELKAA